MWLPIFVNCVSYRAAGNTAAAKNVRPEVAPSDIVGGCFGPEFGEFAGGKMLTIARADFPFKVARSFCCTCCFGKKFAR